MKYYKRKWLSSFTSTVVRLSVHRFNVETVVRNLVPRELVGVRAQLPPPVPTAGPPPVVRFDPALPED